MPLPPRLLLALLCTVALSSAASAQMLSVRRENACDALAGLRLPYSSATQVHPTSETDWPKAVSACQVELLAHPDEIRFRYELARAQDHTHDYIEALRNFKQVVASGYPEAMVDLGAMYYYGHGVVQNYATAFDYFSKAMEGGSNRAMVNLAAMFANGQGVPKDDVKSLDLAEKAVEQGNPFALNIIADHYFNGAGVPRDYKMAAQYLQQAADLGDGRAMKFLANMYESGYLGAPDPAKADELRRRAQQIAPESPDPMPAHLPPFRPATAAASRPVMHPRRYVTYQYNPAWQAPPGDTSCCPNNMLVCPLGRHFCGH